MTHRSPHSAPAFVEALVPTLTHSAGSRAAVPPDLAPPLEPGAEVGFFEIRRLIGEGGMGRVYLARDTRLGRLVALKVLRPDVIGPERVRRFLDEARTTARFSDPHIVIVHELGEQDGQPFIALEYLDGETLRRRMQTSRPAQAEVTRWMLAVARALRAAHAHAVIHCDLKPDNVIVPRDGRVRVVDFGLARAASLAGEPGRAGTAAYMAPEQWEVDGIEPRTDVWAFGVMLLELLTGTNPFRQNAGIETIEDLLADRTDPLGLMTLPASLGSLIGACLRRWPAERLSATQLVERLEGIVDRQISLDTQVDCPFPGLVSFEEEHAGLFFGRDEEIDVFLERLRIRPVLPVIGPSGAGKSSFVRAGVIPRLRALGPWRFVVLRPGTAPLRALAAKVVGLLDDHTADSALLPATDRVEDMASSLRENPQSLVMSLLQAARVTRSRILLFVDQLEEVFTHEADPTDQRRFMEALVHGADEPDEPIRVVFTARDDFMGRLAEVPAVQAALEHVTVLRRLRATELRTVLTRPLERVGHAWDDPRIIDDVLRELTDEIAGLPLLQFACRALWERRDQDRRLLLRSEYEAMGGVGGALAEHADRVLALLTPSQVPAARTLLLRLVGGDGTRRVIRRSAVVAELGPDGEAVIDRLTGSRLVVSRRASAAVAEPTIELAHEALIRAWGTLARWIADSREERALLDELAQAAGLWESRGRRDEEVWPGDAVADARRRLERLSVRPPGPVGAFLEAGAARHRRVVRGRRIFVGATFLLLGVIATAALFAAAKFAEKERIALEQANDLAMATADIGVVMLELRPIDWDPRTLSTHAVPVHEMPDLTLALFAEDPRDSTRPGEKISYRGFTHRRLLDDPGTWVERFEARSGPAWARISGRNRLSERPCGPSWIHLQRLPGFASRAEPPRWVLPVPTCGATLAGTIAVPEGPFLREGTGVPPIRHLEYLEPETQEDLEAYRLDRTEVANAQMKVWAELGPLTGYLAPEVPEGGTIGNVGANTYPATQVDAFTAEEVCMFWGKRLPTSDEWLKAVRGGLMLPSGPNPEPHRSVPWGRGPGKANLQGDGDGYEFAAPVDSMHEGAGPYGHLHLSGNVDEWTATPDGKSRHSLRVIRGGDWDADPALELHTHVYENVRMPHFFSFGIGFRCAL